MANAATLKSPKPQTPPAAAVPASGPGPASAPGPVFAMLSHRGRVRQTNQDVCAARPEHGAFVVCDGMGGAAGGDVASRLATEAFLDRLAHGPASTSASHPRERLADAICAANQAVFEHAQSSRNLHGMGTTLVALFLKEPAPLLARPAQLLEEVAPLLKVTAPQRQDACDGHAPTLWLAHVGDSRCYLFRGGTLHRLTEDHSLVEEQVRAGLLSRAQAAVSPMRSVITRAIGTQSTVEAEIACHAAQSGDLYLLASDGLTRELEDDAIAGILAQILAQIPACTVSPAALDAACHALVDAANANGGHDNITVLLVAFPSPIAQQ